MVPGLTLVMGPETPFRPSPDTEEVGDAAEVFDILEVNPTTLWLTPAASVNCSRSSTLVRPLAKRRKNFVKSKSFQTSNLLQNQIFLNKKLYL